MTTSPHNDPHSAFIKYHGPPHNYHPYPPPGFMAPMATYPHAPSFNPQVVPTANLTSQQSSVVMTSQQQPPSNGTNFCIDHLIGEEIGYRGEPRSPQQQVAAVSHGVSPPLNHDNSITSSSSNGAYNAIMTSIQQSVTSQFAQQYHDDVMTSQQQEYSHHMGNSPHQNHLSMHHQQQSGFYGDVRTDFATLQTPVAPQNMTSYHPHHQVAASGRFPPAI